MNRKPAGAELRRSNRKGASAMKTYQELVKEYRKRQRDTVVDTIATGLTYMDEIAVDSGLLEETGILTDLMENVAGVLPFAIITINIFKLIRYNGTIICYHCYFAVFKVCSTIG